MTVESLSSAGLSKAMARYRDVLLEHQEELNALNVFPAPDGDSGTNLLLTLQTVVEHLQDAHDMASMCGAISKGALRGARGNSGVIMSQFLAGLSRGLTGVSEVTGADLATALRKGSDAAYVAVLRPQEGTILTVARAAADAAESVVASLPAATFSRVLEAASEGAENVLARTPDMLAELREAGVVDSGGKGLTLLFASLLAEADGRSVPGPRLIAPAQAPAARDRRSGSPRFEVLLFLLAGDRAAGALRTAWADLGGSIIVAGEDGLFNCHIHTDRVGAVIEAALSNGPIERVRISDLSRQVDARPGDNAPHRPATPRSTTSASLVLVRGEGARRLFEGLGADVVLDPMRTSVTDLAAVISGMDAESSVIVPSDKGDVQLARDSGAASNVPVAVVCAGVATEALAAMMVFDPSSSADGNAATMTEAMTQVAAGRVLATAGGFEGVDRHGMVCGGWDVEEVTLSLLEHLVHPESEVVTVLYGEGATPDLLSAIRSFVESAHPDLVVEIHEGDQPDPIVLGVE